MSARQEAVPRQVHPEGPLLPHQGPLLPQHGLPLWPNLREPQVRQRIEALGLEVAASTQEELGAFLRAEMAKWEPVIKAAKITAQ